MRQTFIYCSFAQHRPSICADSLLELNINDKWMGFLDVIFVLFFYTVHKFDVTYNFWLQVILCTWKRLLLSSLYRLASISHNLSLTEVWGSTALFQDTCPTTLYVNIYNGFFLIFHLIHHIVCLLLACFRSKASAAAVAKAEESGQQGVSFWTKSGINQASGCKFMKSTKLGELITVHLLLIMYKSVFLSFRQHFLSKRGKGHLNNFLTVSLG